MATHAGVALELGIKRPSASSGGVKMMSPQMEAILIWCQCRVRDYVSTPPTLLPFPACRIYLRQLNQGICQCHVNINGLV